MMEIVDLPEAMILFYLLCHFPYQDNAPSFCHVWSYPCASQNIATEQFQWSKFYRLLEFHCSKVFHLLEGKLPFAVSFRTRQMKSSSLAQRTQVQKRSILASNFFQCYKSKIGAFFYRYRTNFANCKTETGTKQVHLLEPATSEQTKEVARGWLNPNHSN